MDVIDLFERSSSWAKEKIAGAKDKLEAKTPCEEWNIKDVINHLISGQEFFRGSAEGKEVSPPPPNPPDLAGKDPAATYDKASKETLKSFKKPGALDKAGFTAQIAFVDQLIHGWDIAKASGQDAKMPDDLAKAAFETINGKFPTDGSTGFFKKAPKVPEKASVQEKLLSLSGRKA
jgi:uncharacterized protein (TIGR03086 family)